VNTGTLSAPVRRTSATRTATVHCAGIVALAGAVLAVLAVVPARAADIEAGKRKARVCAACHGPTGTSISRETPSIAGQQPQYLFLQLVQFREKRRTSRQMTPVVANMSNKDFEDLAAYFSVQKPAAARTASDPKKVVAGHLVSEKEHCESCHMPGFVGQRHIPRLLGQHFEYILKQLQGFKAQTQADIDGSMTTAVQPLSQQDIENVAHYIASVTPGRSMRRSFPSR